VTDFLKIDIHTHILPERWPDLRERYGYGGWVRLEHHCPGCAKMMVDDRFFREIESNGWDPGTRIGDCDATGVDVQVLSTVPVMFGYWAKPEDGADLSRILNDHIAGIVRDFPERFVGLGTVPMQAPELAVKELDRCVNELGLAGIEIGSHVNDWNLEQADLFPVFEAAAELGAAVFVHPWDMMARDAMPKYWLPWLVGMPAETSLAICSMIFGGVIERLPNLRVAFAHGGGSFPATIGRVQHGFDVRPDLCAVDNDVPPRAYVDRIYLDSLVHEPAALRLLLEVFGAERIALGSDYPFPLGEHHPGQLIESMAELTDATRQRLLAGTALEFLGLPADAFAASARARTQSAQSARSTG
jgi:aminocarboxymuconate-semialdehyde decarboxylase